MKATTSQKTTTKVAIRPFRVDFPPADLDDLHRRVLAGTRNEQRCERCGVCLHFRLI
ncbi:MAG: hypothetical protein H0X24_10790 [Ktedonobacterales bacterium]|nr:hypothetical protein [Ktedonobacterales bacterium]